jgi:hypothetical protein
MIGKIVGTSLGILQFLICSVDFSLMFAASYFLNQCTTARVPDMQQAQNSFAGTAQNVYQRVMEFANSNDFIFLIYFIGGYFVQFILCSY